MVNLRLLSYASFANYLKRSSVEGTALLTLGGASSTVTHTVTHNLGYIPFFQVSADLANDGVIWAGRVVDRYTETSISSYNDDYPRLVYYCTTTTLTISIFNNTSPASSGTRSVYWTLYLDYDT